MLLGFFQVQKGRHHATPRVDDVEKMRVRECMHVCMCNLSGWGQMRSCAMCTWDAMVYSRCTMIHKVNVSGSFRIVAALVLKFAEA